MTKEAALHQFFNSFGIPGYRATAVPHDGDFPYLTYTPVIASFGDDPVSITVQLYFRTESEALPDAKAEELRKRIGPGGVLLPCDGGKIWLRWGAPWCQSFLDETDKTIKRRYINVTADFLTL